MAKTNGFTQFIKKQGRVARDQKMPEPIFEVILLLLPEIAEILTSLGSYY